MREMRSLIAREEQPRNENVRLGGRGVRAGLAHGAISSGLAKTTFGDEVTPIVALAG